MPSLLADFRGQFRPMHRGIRIALWFHAGLVLLSAVALPFDHRTILGLNPWIKPIKFDVSTLIYAATIGLLLAQLTRLQTITSEVGRRIRWIGWAIAIAMMVENTLISMQSVRGVPSHMNYTSPSTGSPLP